MIGLPNSEKPILRAYSICSPNWDEKLEFYSIIVKNGPLTSKLKNIKINDEILLMSVGKNEVNSDIREIIDEDNSLKELDKSTLDKILDFEPIFEADKKENIINASEEKERLEKIKSEINDIDADVKEIENTNDKGEQKFEQTSLHSIATENDENRKPLVDKNNKVDEEDSFLDKILDFDLFGSDDEEPESENQRDSTFFNKEKKKSE